MVNNICMVGLLKTYTKNVAKCVADALEMFYADVRELMEFDLINLAEASKVAGLDYIERQENNKIKTLATYDNTIFTLDYLSLNNESNLENVKTGCLLIFIKVGATYFNKLLKKEDIPNSEEILLKTMRTEHNKVLSEYADIVVEITNEKQDVLELILNKIEEYYENR